VREYESLESQRQGRDNNILGLGVKCDFASADHNNFALERARRKRIGAMRIVLGKY